MGGEEVDATGTTCLEIFVFNGKLIVFHGLITFDCRGGGLQEGQTINMNHKDDDDEELNSMTHTGGAQSNVPVRRDESVQAMAFWGWG